VGEGVVELLREIHKTTPNPTIFQNFKWNKMVGFGATEIYPANNLTPLYPPLYDFHDHHES
jgi:hypothetical protein